MNVHINWTANYPDRKEKWDIERKKERRERNGKISVRRFKIKSTVPKQHRKWLVRNLDLEIFVYSNTLLEQLRSTINIISLSI